MPVRDRPEYLLEAIDSILNQTLQDIELIIIDDASQDPQCLSILRDCERNDKRVRIIRNKKNLRPAGCRNIGLREAKAEYVALMDSDDVSEPERLRTQYDFLQAHPSIAACCTCHKIIDANSKIRENRQQRHDELFSINPSPLSIGLHVATPSMMGRISAIRDVGSYRPWFRLASDMDLSRRLEEKYHLARISQSLYRYRWDYGDNISSASRTDIYGGAANISAVLRRYSLPDPLNNLKCDLWSIFTNAGLLPDPEFTVLNRAALRFIKDLQESGEQKELDICIEKLNAGLARGAAWPTMDPHKELWSQPKNKDKISILMAVQKHNKEVSTAIETLLNQTHQNLELIIVNCSGNLDGISDDDRIRSFHVDSKTSICEAWNIALRYVTGSFIALAQCGDGMPLERLQTQYEYLQANPDIAACYLPQGLADTSSPEQSATSGTESRLQDAADQTSVVGPDSPLHSILVRTEAVYTLGGWRTRYESASNYDFLLRLRERYEIQKLRHPLYRQKETNEVGNPQDLTLMICADISAAHRRHKIFDPVPYIHFDSSMASIRLISAQRIQWFSNIASDLVATLYRNKDYKNAHRYLKKFKSWFQLASIEGQSGKSKIEYPSYLRWKIIWRLLIQRLRQN